LPSFLDCEAGIWHGAIPGTQTLECSWRVQLCVEKFSDNNLLSVGAVASADIEQYYDNIKPLRVAGYLAKLDIHPSIVYALLRVQCLPAIRLNLLNRSVYLKNRTIGAITGTRGAGLLGRIPVADAVDKCRATVQELGLSVSPLRRISCMTWVDNLYTFSESPASAVQMLEQIENVLVRDWSVKFKPCSTVYMQCEGAAACNDLDSRWKSVRVFACVRSPCGLEWKPAK